MAFKTQNIPILVLLVSLCTLTGGCTSDNTISSIPFPPSRIDEITQAMDKVKAAHNAPGVLVGVWETGKAPLVLARGLSDTATMQAIDADQPYRIASVTKTFTALVILQLIDENILTLDMTLDRFLPQVFNAHLITVEQLLHMTAGVYDFFYRDPAVSNAYHQTPLRVWTEQELYRILLSYQQEDFPPGTGCMYSNAGYFILGLIAEQVTGNPVSQEIRTRILEPLAMTNSLYPAGPDMPAGAMHGYRDTAVPGQLEDITRVSPSLPGAAGALISNLHDMQTYVRAMVDGTLISPTLQQARLDWRTMNGCVQYGLGMMNFCGFWGHNGEILGFNNFACYLPEKDAVIIVMANKCNDDGGPAPATDLFLEVTRILYPDHVVW